jgi:glycosyltransferase involved in cell wall biosynthesis
MSDSQRVSVYMPTRDRASLVGRAIESVLRQDHRELELLVVDDASTDDTPAVLAGFAAADPRMRIFRLHQQSGAPAARNVALRAAVGPYVTGIDDDDEMLPGRISSLLRAFEPRYSFACSGAYLHSGTWIRPTATADAVIALDEMLRCNQAGSQVLTLLSRFHEAGLFDESMPAWQDYDLWTRLIDRYGPAIRTGTPTYLQRVEEGTERITERGAEGARRYIEKHGWRMQPAQLDSQQFELFMLERRRLRSPDLRRFASTQNWRRVLRYLVTSNFPSLRIAAERYRRWRWPLRRAPAGLGPR